MLFTAITERVHVIYLRLLKGTCPVNVRARAGHRQLLYRANASYRDKTLCALGKPTPLNANTHKLFIVV